MPARKSDSVVPFRDPRSSKDSSARDMSDSWFDDDPDGGGSGKMSFLEHLDELRKRIVRSLLALCVGVAIAAFFIEDIYSFVMLPLQQMLRPGETMIYTYPTEAFMLYIRIALIAGLFVAAPLIFWQVWLFVAPALYANERRYAIPFVLLSSIGVVAGAAFSHYVAFPLMWRFFASFSNELVSFMPRIEDAFSLYMRMLLGMAAVFQMPAAVFFMARMGVVTARWMIRQFKYAVLGIVIVAAIITPSSDIASQLIVAGPMVVLYILSIGIAWMAGKRKRLEIG
jgi:sec-independent protein translocase protein TatC